MTAPFLHMCVYDHKSDVHVRDVHMCVCMCIIMFVHMCMGMCLCKHNEGHIMRR